MAAHEHNPLETLGYLPAFFRGQVEPVGVVEHNFVRWLLEAFETNLHLVERIVENSQMLIDPDEVAMLSQRVDSPAFSGTDFIDSRSFVAKLTERSDEVSKYLWKKFSRHARQILSNYQRHAHDLTALQDTLA